MKELTIKGTPVPIYFGIRTVNEFSKMEGFDFEDTVTTAAALSSLATIVSLTTFGLNEGARKAGTGKNYTDDDVWDIFDDEPELVFEVSEIFVESIAPKVEKLGGFEKKAPRPTPPKNRRR